MHTPHTLLSVFALGATLVSALGLEARATNCTVAAAGAGKDDAPAFIAAVKSCATTTVPVGTTLNISSKIDMTGLANKHIVSHVALPSCESGILMQPQSLQGTIRMNPNVNYWAGASHTMLRDKQLTDWSGLLRTRFTLLSKTPLASGCSAVPTSTWTVEEHSTVLARYVRDYTMSRFSRLIISAGMV